MSLILSYHQAHLARKKRLFARTEPIEQKPRPKIIMIVNGRQQIEKPPQPEPVKRDFLFLASVPEQPEPFIRTPKTAVIQRIVARHFGLTVVDILSHRRTLNVARTRQIAMYLCRTMTLRSLPDIGRYFGGKDHTTVLHSVRKIAALRLTDPDLDQTIQTLEAKLRGTVQEKNGERI